MSKYKALILDLDGTTVPSSREGMPSEKTKSAVIKAAKHVKVCLATGRPFYLMKNIAMNLEIDDPCVVDGGAEIVDTKTGKLLFKKYISVSDQKAVFDICQRFKLPVFTSEDQYGGSLVNESSIKKETAKLFLDGLKKDVFVALLEELSAVDGISAHLATSWQKGDVMDIHITHSKATKKHAIEELLIILDVDVSETIGVGDSHNDLPLLSSVGLKVVMGNAPEEMKSNADYVAPSLQEDGVADVIQKFILSDL